MFDVLVAPQLRSVQGASESLSQAKARLLLSVLLFSLERLERKPGDVRSDLRAAYLASLPALLAAGQGCLALDACFWKSLRSVLNHFYDLQPGQHVAAALLRGWWKPGWTLAQAATALRRANTCQQTKELLQRVVAAWSASGQPLSSSAVVARAAGDAAARAPRAPLPHKRSQPPEPPKPRLLPSGRPCRHAVSDPAALAQSREEQRADPRCSKRRRGEDVPPPPPQPSFQPSHCALSLPRPSAPALAAARAALGGCDCHPPAVRNLLSLEAGRPCVPCLPGARCETLGGLGLADAATVYAVHGDGSVDLTYDYAAARASEPVVVTIPADIPLFQETQSSARLFHPPPGERVRIFDPAAAKFSLAVVESFEGSTCTVAFDVDALGTKVLDVYSSFIAPAPPRGEGEQEGAFVLENVRMDQQSRQRMTNSLPAQLHCQAVSALADGSDASRDRLIWSTCPPSAEPPHDPDALRLLLGAERLDLRRLFNPELGDKRTHLAAITTSAHLSAPELERLNALLPRGRSAFTPSKLGDLRAANAVWDQAHGCWRNLTAREAEAALSLPKGHVSSHGLSHSASMRMLGDSFDQQSIFRVLRAQLPRLAHFTTVNLLSLFDGIGGGPVAAMALHRLGLIRLGTIISVEIDAARRAVFKAHFDAQALPGVRLVTLADVLAADDASLRELLVSVGGAHLVVCGSPCNNFAGSNRHMDCANGRVGLEGNLSSLFFEAVRILRVVRSVPLAFSEIHGERV